MPNAFAQRALIVSRLARLPDETWISRRDAAALLNCHVNTIFAYERRGLMKAWQIVPRGKGRFLLGAVRALAR